MHIDMSDIAHLDPEEGEQIAYWQRRYFKRKHRRFTGKPVRKARRFVKRRGGFGGRRAHQYLIKDATEAYFKKRGKRRFNKRSTGFGVFGRKGNP